MYGKALASDPSDMRARLGVSVALAANGKREEALCALQDALGDDVAVGGPDVEGAVKGLVELSGMGGLDEHGANPRMELVRACLY